MAFHLCKPQYRPDFLISLYIFLLCAQKYSSLKDLAMFYVLLLEPEKLEKGRESRDFRVAQPAAVIEQVKMFRPRGKMS